MGYVENLVLFSAVEKNLKIG